MMYLNVELGEYRCSSAPRQQECGLKNNEGRSKPPVKIRVDFGDGSGEQVWSREDQKNLWGHQYRLPGMYLIHVSSMLLLNK